MHLSCLQENFKRGLSIVGHAVAGKTTLPVLSNILLATDAGRLKLAATDLELGITYWLGASITADGGVTIPAKLLTDVVGALPNDRVTLELDARTQTVHLACLRAEANIKGIEADEFPVLPPLPPTAPIATLAPDVLRTAINQVAVAAATAMTRPALAGVLMRLRGNMLILAAADGFRLAVRTLTLPMPVATPVEAIVPATALLELARVLSDMEDHVAITITPYQGHIVFHTATVEVISRLIEGRFPDFERIIPQQYATRAVLERLELTKATKLAAYVATASSNIVRLTLATDEISGRGTLTLAANATEVGDNQTTVDSTVNGPSERIALNVTFLHDAIDACGTPQVALELQSSSAPAVFKPVGDDSYVHIIMPMTVEM